MNSGAELITLERARQIKQEGWTREHDDEHTDRSLAMAAVCYAEQAGNDWSDALVHRRGALSPYGWPWDEQWWKPTGDAIRDLTKAGALIAAEIDRLERLTRAAEGLITT